MGRVQRKKDRMTTFWLGCWGGGDLLPSPLSKIDIELDMSLWIIAFLDALESDVLAIA